MRRFFQVNTETVYNFSEGIESQNKIDSAASEINKSVAGDELCNRRSSTLWLWSVESLFHKNHSQQKLC